MKIKPEHYAVLSKAVRKQIELNPCAEMEYRAASLSPQRLRWDYLWMSKLRIGDSVGMGPGPDDTPDTFVPIYDYANDDHIDTALRRICKEAGVEYGAVQTSDMLPYLQPSSGKQYLANGSFVAELETSSAPEGQPPHLVRLTCAVRSDGAVFSRRDHQAFAVENTSKAQVIDIIGGRHEVIAEAGVLRIADFNTFKVQHSEYVITQHSETSEPGEDDEPFLDITTEYGEPETHEYDTLRFVVGEAGVNEFSGNTLRSTDPSGLGQVPEECCEVRKYVTINQINGKPAEPEQVAMLGQALGLTPESGLDSANTHKEAMRLG